MDPIRYLIGKDCTGRITLWCTDCPTPGPRVGLIPIWNEDGAAEQVTELCLANLVAIAEEHEREHHAEDTKLAAPAPPSGSYWTDLNGKVWDLSCQYLDRHHRLWHVAGFKHGPMLDCIQMPGAWFPLKHVEAEYGPLTRIPPKIEPELTHYGNGTHGGRAPHKGTRENCPAPECLDAEADAAEERDEETRRVRILLNSVSRFIETWAESDGQARTDLWRGLSAAADPVADLFEARIADLDHRAAQLPDGGLAMKP